jgi:hypothetical protein
MRAPLPVTETVATVSTESRGRRRLPDSGYELPEVWGSPPTVDAIQGFGSAGRTPPALQFDLEWRGVGVCQGTMAGPP